MDIGATYTVYVRALGEKKIGERSFPAMPLAGTGISCYYCRKAELALLLLKVVLLRK
jgi:hypothetical protein